MLRIIAVSRISGRRLVPGRRAHAPGSFARISDEACAVAGRKRPQNFVGALLSLATVAAPERRSTRFPIGLVCSPGGLLPRCGWMRSTKKSPTADGLSQTSTLVTMPSPTPEATVATRWRPSRRPIVGCAKPTRRARGDDVHREKYWPLPQSCRIAISPVINRKDPVRGFPPIGGPSPLSRSGPFLAQCPVMGSQVA
jgi:hypothetical protein